jgi:hypothetical protein
MSTGTYPPDFSTLVNAQTVHVDSDANPTGDVRFGDFPGTKS